MKSRFAVKLEFLKSFWEDEGSISFDGRLMADLKNKKIIEQIGKLMENFGLKLKICRYKEPTGFMYKLYLSKSRSNLKRFLKLGFFEKSVITHGKNKGKKKLDILVHHIKK